MNLHRVKKLRMEIKSLSQEQIHPILDGAVDGRTALDDIVDDVMKEVKHPILEVNRYYGVGVQSPPHCDLVGCSKHFHFYSAQSSAARCGFS